MCFDNNRIYWHDTHGSLNFDLGVSHEASFFTERITVVVCGRHRHPQTVLSLESDESDRASGAQGGPVLRSRVDPGSTR